MSQARSCQQEHGLCKMQNGGAKHEERGAIQAHLSPKAQIQDPLALNLALRLDLNHTAVLIGCHDSYAHPESICHGLEGHMVPPCAKLLHTLTVLPIIFRNVLPIQVGV